MRLFVTAVVLVCGSCAMAQTKGADTPAPVQMPVVTPQTPIQKHPVTRAASPGMVRGKAKAVNVPPGTPVVTLQGVCKERQPKSACKTVITRDDLDKFAEAFGPEVSETARDGLAVQYARTLAFSALAAQQGLEKDPALAKELDLQLKLLRMRILSSAFLQSLQAHMASITESEIQKYYDGHRDQYEQVQARRLSVPFAVPTESGRPLDRSAVKSEMEELRSRAVAGEDFNQLQQDAYKQLHIQATPPPVNVLALRRSTLQGDETKAFDLNPGEISAVLDLPAAFAMVKVESKEPIPIQSVRQEIDVALRRERMQNEVRRLTKKFSAEFNLTYLEMSSQPDVFGQAPAIGQAASRGGSIRRMSGARP